MTSGSNGTLTIQGTGGTGPGGLDYGVLIGGIVTSGGPGSPVNIEGTGGSGSAGSDDGVYVYGTVTSGGGNISVTGTGGPSGNFDFGINVQSGGTGVGGAFGHAFPRPAPVETRPPRPSTCNPAAIRLPRAAAS